MKPTAFDAQGVLKRILASVLALSFLLVATTVANAASARKLLRLDIAEDRLSAVVRAPAGYDSVVLQKSSRRGGWEKVASKPVVKGAVKFKLPPGSDRWRWRAVGRFNQPGAPRGKFPKAFYQGNHEFGAAKSSLSTAAGLLRAMDLAGAESTPDLPEEADIWKVDGRTVYFFNQLRGLQVLDLTDVADPRLVASLRLPAEGEDLYLLPGGGSTRTLVLLTRKYTGNGDSMTRIQMVEVGAGSARVAFRQDVPGDLTDSRLVGNRLILATTEWGGDVVDADVTTSGGGSVSHLTEWIVTPGQAPSAAGGFELEGDYPLISAGADWLAVAVTPADDWRHSEVTVFGLDAGGLTRLTGSPIRTAGVVQDKFKMQWRDNVLTTISEKSRASTDWRPVTVLETFRVWGAGVVHIAMVEGRLGRLELADGESLHATRFADGKVYVVTFFQQDPLWVVDLSDPAKPWVTGSIGVPGWSSYLEPIGDLLFAIGWDNGSIAASLFDVANPSAPKLLKRLVLGDSGSYSEAAWDEQALKVIPDAGLAMIPLTTFDLKNGGTSAVVQLLDLDIKGGGLTQRGAIHHDFDARRSELLGGTAVSISQRVLVSADIADLDHPSILAEVSLAWPVDRALDAGTHLVHIEDGGYSGRATARVTPADDPEAVWSETDLGKGQVCGADLRDGKLYVLRDTNVSFWGPVVFAKAADGNNLGKLTLDVYDATSLPTLHRIGSCSLRHGNGTRVTGRGLLWPQANRPVAVLDAGSSFWFGDVGTGISKSGSLAETAGSIRRVSIPPVSDGFPFWRPARAPMLAVFDVSEPDQPGVVGPVRVGTNQTIPNSVYQTGDGLLVMGAGDWKRESNGKSVADGKVLQSVYVVDVPVAGEPVVRPVIDLPGELFAVTSLDQNGFLAFTRDDEGASVKVCACDGYDAFEVAGVDVDLRGALTAGGRRLFVAVKGGVERHRLTEEGVLVREPDLELGWRPADLRWTDGVLLGTNWNALFAAGPTDETARKWNFTAWSLRFDRVSVASDGDLLIPLGEYGAERKER